MSNTASTDSSKDYSKEFPVCQTCNVHDNRTCRYSVFSTGMGTLCFLFFLGTLLFCSCTGPRFPSASKSPKDPYAENGPKTPEEEAYYQDVYSGEWREQTGPFGFAKSIGKKSGSKTMPPHWAMMPHGAKTMSEIKTETAMRQSDRLAYNSYAGAPMPGGYAMPGQPGNMPSYNPSYNPVSTSPAPYAQIPSPGMNTVPGTLPNAQAVPTPNYVTPTYHGQGQFVPAVVERPVVAPTAVNTNLPPYTASPQSMQNPPYTQPPAGIPQGQTQPTQQPSQAAQPSPQAPISQPVQTPAMGETLPPVTFPPEYQPQTMQSNGTVGEPVTSAPAANAAVPFLPPTNAMPAPGQVPLEKTSLPQTTTPNQTDSGPATPMPSAFPQFNGLPNPVSSSRTTQRPITEEVATSHVFFSHDMIIRGQAPATAKPDNAKAEAPAPSQQTKNGSAKAVQGGDDLFDLPTAAPATVSKVSDAISEPSTSRPQANQNDAADTAETHVFSERLGGRQLPLKIDPKLETTWKSLSQSMRTNANREVVTEEGVAQSSGFLREACPEICPDASGKLPPYVNAKKTCPKYGREGKMNPGYSPYEYIMDGSDSKGEAYATPDWNVHHLDQEDTIAHFDTVDGQILVEPSNRVCIYSPRFGSVRQIIGLRESDQNLLLHKAEATIGTASSQKLATVDVRSQDEKVKHTLAETRLSGMAAKDLGHIVSGEVAVMENNQETYLGDMTALIRHSALTDDVKVTLTRGMQAAQNWGSMESVRVAIGEVFATANIYANGPMTMYHVENGTKSSKLQLIKVASKDAAQPGELIEFILRYENVGDQVIGNVTLLDNLSSRLVYVDRSAKSSRKGEFLVNENKQGSVILRWEITEPLKPGEFGIVEFICKVR